MAHRTSKRPRASIVMAVHDAEAHLNRAVESVLCTDATDVQVVIVDCASSDSTTAIARRMAERDIRVDVCEAGAADTARALDIGLSCARGFYVLFMGQDDWFVAQGLGRLLDAAEADRLDFAIPFVSIDRYRGRGELTSVAARQEMTASRSTAEFHRSVPSLIEKGLLDTVRGKLLRLEAVSGAAASFSGACHDLEFLVGCLDTIERAAIVPDAVFHLTAHESQHSGFDPVHYGCCRRNHELLIDLADRWAMRDSTAFMLAVHLHHLRSLVCCIENACAAGRRLSGIERNARVRDMLEERGTCESVAAVRERSRDLGFMYGAIAKGNVAACCMGARLIGFMRASRLPLAPLLRDASVCGESLICAVGRGIPDVRQGHLEGDRA